MGEFVPQSPLGSRSTSIARPSAAFDRIREEIVLLVGGDVAEGGFAERRQREKEEGKKRMFHVRRA